MKYFKSFLLASVFSSVLIPASFATITPDDLEKHIRNTRSCAVAVVVDQESPAEKGWFSTFRQEAGKAARWLGNALRTEDDPRTAAGHVSQMAKNGLVRGLSYMTGIPLKKEILNPLGNIVRYIGQKIKGGEATQTTTRVILNNLGLNKSSKERDIAEALSTVATASLKADTATAIQTYEDVVLGLKRRGFSTINLDTEQIYLSALARQTLLQNPDATCASFSRIMFAHGMPVLNKMNGIKGASDGEKVKLMRTYLTQVFNDERAMISSDAARLSRTPAI